MCSCRNVSRPDRKTGYPPPSFANDHRAEGKYELSDQTDTGPKRERGVHCPSLTLRASIAPPRLSFVRNATAGPAALELDAHAELLKFRELVRLGGVRQRVAFQVQPQVRGHALLALGVFLHHLDEGGEVGELVPVD